VSNYGLWSLFGPLGILGWTLLVALAAITIGGPRGRRIGTLAIVLGTIQWLIVFPSPLGFWLLDPLETRFAPPTGIALAPVTDIVMLSGGERLGPASRHHRPEYGEEGDRVIGGAMLAHALPRARLWTVGGMRETPNTPRDVDWTALVWRSVGIAPERIGIIGGTRDTCENAQAVAARLPASARIAIVTSAFHLPRAMACFRSAGLEPLPYPVDYMNGSKSAIMTTLSHNMMDNEERLDFALHEYLGLAYYRLTGRTSELWPAPKAASGERLRGS